MILCFEAFLANPLYIEVRVGAKEGGAGEAYPPIDMLGPPIDKLFLLNTAAFVRNFKLCPPLTNAWPLSVDRSGAGSD